MHEDLLILGEGSLLHVVQFLSKFGEEYISKFVHIGQGTINKIVKVRGEEADRFLIGRDMGSLEIFEIFKTKDSNYTFTVSQINQISGENLDIKDVISIPKSANSDLDIALAIWEDNDQSSLSFTSITKTTLEKHLVGRKVCCVQHVRDKTSFLLCIEGSSYLTVYDRSIKQCVLTVRNPSNDTFYHSLQPLPFNTMQSEYEETDFQMTLTPGKSDAAVTVGSSYFLLKDRKSVSFVNLAERAVIKLANSRYLDYMNTPMHNSLLFCEKIQY